MPDFANCDFAISFSRLFEDNPDHMRIPNWVQRFHQHGSSPKDLLKENRHVPDRRGRFAAFVFNRQVQQREEFFETLNGVGQVDARVVL